MAEVYELQIGYFIEKDMYVIAASNITLIKSTKACRPFYTLVDLGGPWNTETDLKNWLAKHNTLPDLNNNRRKLEISDINAAVITHNHPDHTELKSRLRNTKIYGPDSIYYLSIKDSYELPAQDRFNLCDDVIILRTPGHTDQDQSVLVKTPRGLVAVVGDLWLNKSDSSSIDCFDKWLPYDTELAINSRKKILEYNPVGIIPGHGERFKLNYTLLELPQYSYG